jgi:hypothetical protein
MHKTALPLVLFLLIALQSTAQTKTKKLFQRESAFIGGNVTLPLFGLLQGQNDLMIGANPHFGYSITDNVDVAAVLNLQKNKYEISENSILNLINNKATAKVSMIGLGTFTRFYILDIAFLQLQPEVNYITINETKYIINGFNLPTTTTTKTNKIKPSLLIGAGYKRGFNRGKTFFYATILYDLITKNSPYSNGVASALTGSQSVPFLLRAGFNVMLKDLKRNNNSR